MKQDGKATDLNLVTILWNMSLEPILSQPVVIISSHLRLGLQRFLHIIRVCNSTFRDRYNMARQANGLSNEWNRTSWGVADTPVSYAGGPGIKFRPGNRLYLLSIS
jgi:hypothetical protein